MAIAKIEIEVEGREDNNIELDGVFYFPIRAARVRASKNQIEYHLDSGIEFEYYTNGSPEDTLVLAQAVLIVTTDSVVLSGQTIDGDGDSYWQDDHLIVKSFEIVDKFPTIK